MDAGAQAPNVPPPAMGSGSFNTGSTGGGPQLGGTNTPAVQLPENFKYTPPHDGGVPIKSVDGSVSPEKLIDLLSKWQSGSPPKTQDIRELQKELAQAQLSPGATVVIPNWLKNFSRLNQIERRIDPEGGGKLTGGKPPTTGGFTAAAGVFLPTLSNPPAEGWAKRYERCTLALRGNGVPNSGLNAILLKLKIEEKGSDALDALSKASNVDRAAFVKAVREYDEACLTGSSIQPPELLKSVGILTLDGVPLCSAVLVNRDTVLTARHCFWEDGQFAPERRPAAKRVRFHVLDSIASGHLVTDLRENAVNKAGGLMTGGSASDYVFLKIENPLSLASKLLLGKPSEGDGIIVFGVNRLVYLAQVAVLDNAMKPKTDADKGQVLIAAAMTSVRWDDSPLCQIIKVGAACFYHLCQTLEGYSGSPVIRVNATQKRLELAGLHTGSLPRAGDSCNITLPNNGEANIGTYAKADVDKAISSTDWTSFVAD